MNHPFSRNRRAVSRPIPDAAPVIKIDLRPLAFPIEFSACCYFGSNIVEFRGGWRLECFVYVLGSRGTDGYRTYVGWTNDLDRRLARHNAGTGARSTRGRVWFLLYAERHLSREEAMSREWHLKRDRAFRKRLLPGAKKLPAHPRSGYYRGDESRK